MQDLYAILNDKSVVKNVTIGYRPIGARYIQVATGKCCDVESIRDFKRAIKSLGVIENLILDGLDLSKII